MMSGIGVLAGGLPGRGLASPVHEMMSSVDTDAEDREMGDNSTGGAERVAGFSKRKAVVSPVSIAIGSTMPGSCGGWL